MGLENYGSFDNIFLDGEVMGWILDVVGVVVMLNGFFIIEVVGVFIVIFI